MSKYLKMICWCCGWFTYEANPEHPHNIFFKYQSPKLHIRVCDRCHNKLCQNCNHQVHNLDDIPVLDPLTFEEGEG